MATFVVKIEEEEVLTKKEGRAVAANIKDILEERLSIVGLEAEADSKLGFKVSVKFQE